MSGRPSDVADGLAAVRAAFDPDRFRRDGQAIVDLLADHLARAQAGAPMPVLPWLGPDASVDHWGAALARSGTGAGLDLPALLAQVVERSNHLHHPGYVGHQVTPPLPAAALCDLVGSLLNNGSAVYEMGPVTTAMERLVIGKLAGQLGMAAGADGVFTSGGSAGNLTALLAARQARAGFDVWTQGNGANGAVPPLTFLCSAEAHYSLGRPCRSWDSGPGAPGRFRWTAASAWTRRSCPGPSGRPRRRDGR